MKTYALALAFSVLSLSVFATSGSGATTTGPTASSKGRIPKYYIFMKRGKLVEMNRGHQHPVKKDITLTNETTIHPNGAINAGSGQSLQLHEGQYITMDGKIRFLKDMGR